MTHGGELPPGWCWATLGDLSPGFLNGFGKRRQDNGTPAIVLRLADITEGVISLSSTRRVNSTAEEVDKYRLAEDDLLAIRVNGSPNLVGRLVRFTTSGEPILFCDHFIRVRLALPGMSRYVRLFADTPAVRDFIDRNKVCSAGQNTISQSTLETLAVPLPPYAEQGRITVRVDELLSDLDAGVAALEQARANLKKYRAAVLKAAVTGELTADWRAAHPDVEPATKLLDRILAERRRKWEADQKAKFNASGKTPPKGWQQRYPEPIQTQTTDLPKLPSEWCWATMDMLVCESPQNGAYYPRQLYGGGTPIIRIDDYQNFSSRPSTDLQRVNCPSEDVTGYSVQTGDILVNRVNSPSHLGKCVLIEERHTPALFESNMMRLRLGGSVEAAYIRDYLRSSDGKQRLVTNAKWAVNQASINQQDVLAVPIPLPPLAEQCVITTEIAERLSVISATEEYISASLKRAARLRQSILKEAFAGRLVPQDPADEPASEMLQRIREQSRVKLGTNPTTEKAVRKQRKLKHAE